MAELHWAKLSGGRLTTGGDAQATFPFWSFTKTVIAHVARHLAQDGIVGLDATLPGEAFTLRHLLRHTSGLPDYGALDAYHAAVSRGDAPWPFEDVLQRSLAHAPTKPPQTIWRYSNIGYRLAVDHMEATSGMSLHTLIRSHIANPLGSNTLRLAPSPDGFAHIHWAKGRSYDPGWVYHHCLIGTPVDAVRALHLILTDGPQDTDTATDLGGAVPGRPWTRCGYGMGAMRGEMEGVGRAIGHSGAGPFCVNAVYRFPDQNDAPIVATFAPGPAEGVAEWAAKSLVT